MTKRSNFERDGYLHERRVFSATDLAALEQDFDRIVKQLRASGEAIDATWKGKPTARLADERAEIIHTHDVQKYSARWLQAFFAPKLLDTAEALLGPNVVLHHSKLFLKPAGAGSPFPMHQDWSYFPTEKDTMLAAIIFVSDGSDAMGGLRVYPGSHKLGRVPNSSGEVECPALAKYTIENATVVDAKAGDVVFFHYFTLHGSTPNRSARDRKTVLIQLHAGDDRCEPSDHPNERLVLRGWNHATTRHLAGQ